MTLQLFINVIIILVGTVLFFIFIRQNFLNNETDPGSCDCSKCSSDTCVSRNNASINPDK